MRKHFCWKTRRLMCLCFPSAASSIFQDAYGNRYLDVKHWKVSVMDRPELLAQCYEVYPDHPMLKLSNAGTS